MSNFVRRSACGKQRCRRDWKPYAKDISLLLPAGHRKNYNPVVLDPVVIEQPVAVPGPVLITVAKAVAVLPTSVDRLVGNTALTKEAQLTAGESVP